jgi:hypothetical protein
MKKTIRLKFENWDYGKESNFFLNLLKKDYNIVVTDDNPDFIIFDTYYGSDSHADSVISKRGLRKKIKLFISKIPVISRIFFDYYLIKMQKMPKISSNAKKIFYSPCNCNPDMSKCDIAITSDHSSMV